MKQEHENIEIFITKIIPITKTTVNLKIDDNACTDNVLQFNDKIVHKLTFTDNDWYEFRDTIIPKLKNGTKIQLIITTEDE